jgi:hypothetical protein
LPARPGVTSATQRAGVPARTKDLAPRARTNRADPEGEEGDRHGTPLPPDQAISVSSKVAFSPSVSGSFGFDGLTHEPNFV